MLSLLVASAAFFALAPTSALAALTRPALGFSPLTGSGSGVTIHNPWGLAINEASGNVFLADGNGGGGAVLILSANGTEAPAGLVSPFSIPGFTFEEPAALAFDNAASSPSKGALYVYKKSSEKIQKYVRDAGTEQYKLESEISATGAGATVGAGVDGAGNLYLGSFTAKSVYKFNASGVLQKTYNLGTPTTNVVRPSQVAVDNAGDLFVQRASGGVWKFPVNGLGEIEPTVFNKFVSETASGVAYDPTTNHVFVALGNHVAEYNATTLAKIAEFGSGVLTNTDRLAVNASTDRVYVANKETNNVAVFGSLAEAPIAECEPASGVTGTKATLHCSASAKGGEISECKFEYGIAPSFTATAPCEGTIPSDFSNHPIGGTLTGLSPNLTTYQFRLVVKNGLGTVQSPTRTFTTSTTVTTLAATSIAPTTATLNASITQEEGSGKFTECKFEYLSPLEYSPQTKSCAPTLGEGDNQAHAVTASLTGLTKNTTYHFRVVATNAGGAVRGADLIFKTTGPPQISEEQPMNVEKKTATLRALVDPSGFATLYRFEWGTSTAYGHRVPLDFEPPIGAGAGPVVVSANLSGLDPASAYHFRVVATNSQGSTLGPDQELETLNEYGLPNHRGPEMVSLADKRPIGNIEQLGAGFTYQPAVTGDQMSYLISGGAGETPAGGELIYSATRSADGWHSVAMSPPSLVTSPEAPGDHFLADTGFVQYVNPENGHCAVVSSFNPLSPDTPEASVELGVTNLYRWNAVDGTYTLISGRVPRNATSAGQGSGAYSAIGMSSDCSKVFFRSTYSFLPGASGLYEWDEGSGLHDAARLPDGSVASLTLSQVGFVANLRNTVAPNGNFFFPAISNEGPDSGKRTVFVRKSPTETIDASAPTNGPTLGALYQGASPDGSHVFFLANYGIAATSSVGPPSLENCSEIPVIGGEVVDAEIRNVACDLYSYDVDTGELTDVSANATPANTKGAVVQGTLAISKDGSVVYFAARGQLVPGKGRTYAENLQDSGFANIYRYDADAPPGEALAYVGSLTALDIHQQALLRQGSGWTSQTDDAGDYLLYASRDNMSGTNPQQVESAYVYTHTSRTNECISCPRDGTAPGSRYPVDQSGAPTVLGGITTIEQNNPALIRSLSADGRVIFNSEDVLAPGAVKGEGKLLGTFVVKFPVQTNIYEWHDGQVSLLATGKVSAFGMAGPEGRDVFIKTYDHLTGYDFDSAADVYDLRGGGGFPSPPTPTPPCDPSADQCQGAPTGQSSAANPATQSFTGPGNPPVSEAPKQSHCRKGKVRRGKRCVKKGKAHKRAAKVNRGGAK
jgi:hypothetical protein